ncbi:MAG: hypothetical protein FJY58_10120 [Betaproteobacteria bacterium]|nr:hypothetical protein [Betaproteobacteria bacterium]
MSIDFSITTQQRTPCMLVLDASGSMNEPGHGGTRIEQLNRGLETLRNELQSDTVARSRVQIAITCVGGPSSGAELLMNWTDAREFVPLPLNAAGATPLGEGLLLALNSIAQLKEVLRKHGISYTRPWMMVVTDGEATDPSHVWSEAVRRCREAEQGKQAQIWPIAVAGANISKLQEITTVPVRELGSLKFSELFQWLSASLSAVTRSRPGESLQLPSSDPWTSIKA